MSTSWRSIKRLLCFVFAVICSIALFNYSSQSFFSMTADYGFWKQSGAVSSISNVCFRNYSNASMLGIPSLLLHVSNLSVAFIAIWNIDVDALLNMSQLERDFHQAGIRDGGYYTPPNCDSRQRIAILVPFRNRSEHLVKFLAHMHPFLQKQNTTYRIFLIEQVD